MTSSAGPLKLVRLVTLGLAWCFAVISGSLGKRERSCTIAFWNIPIEPLSGLNALIKSNQQKSHLKKLGAPATVDIDTHGEPLQYFLAQVQYQIECPSSTRYF